MRDQFIHLVLGEIKIEDLLGEWIGKRLDEESERRILLLLRAQYERQRMFTSCGWYFDDFDRIEPRNNVAYAAQAVWLTYLATGVDLKAQTSNFLHPVKSWRSGLRADAVFTHHMQRAKTTQ